MTAVEWLFKELLILDKKMSIEEILTQAKEKEKEQQGYSEEEVLHLLKALQLYKLVHTERIDIEEWFKQFKNK